MRKLAENPPSSKETIESLRAQVSRFSSIYDTIGDIIFDLSVEAPGKYRFHTVNKAFCDAVGLDKSQINGQLIEDIVPEPFLSNILQKYLEAITTKKTIRWEEPVDYPDRRMVNEVTLVPVFNEKAICTNIVGSLHDITERKQTEDIIRTSEQKWRSFVTKSPDGIAITRIDGFLEELSPKTLKMFGFELAEEVIGKSLFDFVDQSYHEKIYRLISDILGGTYAGADEFLAIKKDGTRFFIEVNSELIRNAQGEPGSFIHIIRDITERKQSEKTISMLAQAIRSVSECVSITDMSDKIIYVNNAFLKTYQYEEHELLGNTITMVRSDTNEHDYVREILPATLRGGWHGELLNRRKDGSEFPVYISTSVIRDENGQPLGLIGVSTDITDRRHAEQVLQESEARNKALLSAIPDLMFMFDREGNFIDYHVRVQHMLFLEPELFINHSVFDVLPQELADKTIHHLKDVFENGNTSVYEYNIQIGNEIQWFESRIVPCGKNAALSIVRDITDQKKMESQMIQSERLAALGEMSAGMAHEINQPLNTLSMLFDNILFEAKENHLVNESYLVSKSEKIFNNIMRIKNIIDHVREFSKDQEHDLPALFKINESILNALSMVSEQYKMAGIDLKTVFSEELPLLNGNAYKFERIILNLIINSKDALLEKKNELNMSFPMFIKITTGHDGQNIRIEVEDNGCGIKDEHMNKVLQPFYSTKETGKGTGLGLSISFGLIREMNGTIDIRSKVMKGTLITITIPYKS